MGLTGRTARSSAISRQQANDDPFIRVGEQDMTAHVDFTSLAAAGETAWTSGDGIYEPNEFSDGTWG